MKTALYARIVFGLAAVAYGIIALMWHDADTWQTLGTLWHLPFGAVVGNCLMVAQIVGGVLVLFPGTARLAAIVLGIVYLLFSLTCVPDIIHGPRAYYHYGSFFEQFSLLVGALAVYASTEPDAARSAALGRAARFGLGLCAISFTLAQIFYLEFTASLVPTWIPPNQMFWAVLTTFAFGFAAIAILANLKARLAMRLMTVMLGVFGILVWIPLLVAHPEAHLNWSECILTFQITGAAWVVAELQAF
ncbi:MAG TPA: hypothetical protein VEJ41_02910 [Candidatus Acidoferrales bacterium]|nr:hypothetical protein [Candidatus Acidoferrales bacterium]